SRQVNNFPLILSEIIKIFEERGAKPFIVPAMGSHGGATAEGQRGVLAGMGITEETTGVPILSSMETVTLGYTGSGLRVELDKNAYEADSIFIVHRIKPHTSFRYRIESGLMKMIVIGLGKQYGAESCHSTKIINLGPRIEEMGIYAIAHSNIIGGLGIVENAYDDTAELVGLLSENFVSEEPKYLEKAKKYLAQILFKGCDVIVVDEIGKNISGAGMDPNVIKRFTTPDMKEPPITQTIVALDLTAQSHGNGCGMGLADFTTRRLYGKVDLYETYPHPRTSPVFSSTKIPMVMDNDRQAIRAAVKCCFDIDQDNPRIIHLHNTLCMDEFYISESMVEEAQRIPHVDVIGAPEEFKFDENGNLF
ncbi:MAG: lactate racemase domain-containing protein, partial [Clostridiaceae bacterium]|nr:lactate racemase domain-containing protein [Clostridiaceae bacterium]